MHKAGSSISLSCASDGGQPPLSYLWNSTCSNCFALHQSTQMISKEVLHSRDTGVHTCTVSDYIGISGIASINLTVEGLLMCIAISIK